jgi:hypothetical protein
VLASATRHDTSEPEGDRGQQIPAADTFEAVAHGEGSGQYRDAGMDRAAGVERVVEIERMTHTGVQERRLRRRQPDAAQEDTAFRQPAPAGDHGKKLVDPWGAAAAEHAAEGIENVAAGGCDGARRQVGVAGAGYVPGQRPRRVVGHRLLRSCTIPRHRAAICRCSCRAKRRFCLALAVKPSP